MILKKLDVSDVKKIVLLHDDSFPDFFLTTLGKPFLEVLYKSIILHLDGIAVGIFENENLLGFAIGSCKKSGFYSDIFKRNFFELGLYCLPSLIRRPQIGKRIFKSLFSKATSEDFIIENATLLSICVDPKQSKRGLGALILKEFEKEASPKEYRLFIAGDGNLRGFVVNSILQYELKKTKYVGRLKPEELVGFYKNCDIALSTYSKDSTVSMPIKAFDYFAAGLPMLNSLGMDLGEMVQKYKIGLNYKAGDHNDLFNKLEFLSDNPKILAGMKENTLKLALNFDEKDIYKEYVEFCEEVLFKIKSV